MDFALHAEMQRGSDSGPGGDATLIGVITFIRHGQAGSRQVYDTLSWTGHRQARALGEWLAGRGARFDRVVTGQLSRQRETAASLIAALSEAGVACPAPVADAGWDEFDLDAVYAGIGPQLAARDAEFRADYEALQREMADPAAAVHRQWRKCDVLAVRAWVTGEVEFPGESFQAFSRRVRGAFEALNKEEHVAVVTSATPIAVCAALALDLGPLRVMQLAAAQHNTSYSEMTMRGEEPRLLSFNNTPHLSPELKTLR